MADILLERGMERLDDRPLPELVERYSGWFRSGREALSKLWNEKGGYFNIDAFSSDIMTDQLFGSWLADITGLNDAGEPVVAPDRVRRTLGTIHRLNVLAFGRGLMGAVNGRTAGGGQLFTDQGDEVWTGTTYAYASHCILAGLVDQGMRAAYGVYYSTYSPYGFGFFFKTPEAYCNPEEFQQDGGRLYGRNIFRAQKYMRPGAVWAVYEALLKKRP